MPSFSAVPSSSAVLLIRPFLSTIVEDSDDSNDDDDTDLAGRAVQAYLKLEAERRSAVAAAVSATEDQSDADDEESDDSNLAAKAAVAFSQMQLPPQPTSQVADPSSTSEVEVSQSETESDGDCGDLASRAAQLYHTHLALIDAATNPAAESLPSETNMDVDLQGFSLKIPTGEYTAEHFASVPDDWIM
jgi:acetyl/propionyl-CoA carboxylase alpha subunit